MYFSTYKSTASVNCTNTHKEQGNGWSAGFVNSGSVNMSGQCQYEWAVSGCDSRSRHSDLAKDWTVRVSNIGKHMSNRPAVQ